MQGFNCIMVYSQDGKQLLFCKRTKNPYKGLYNLVGGKIEHGEDGYEAAYRELEEETGINSNHIELRHMMDFTYYNQDCYVEVYAGTLKEEVSLHEEAHPLLWLGINENFFDSTRFAGEGNIGHMVEQVTYYGMGISRKVSSQENRSQLSITGICIGVDGCKNGWIGAILDHGKLIIDRFPTVGHLIEQYPHFDEFLIDMIIGFQSQRDHVRPDSFARTMIKERASTIFPSPCRQAVSADTISEAYEENVRVLGKKFTPLTVGILPKMKEVDTFLSENPQYKNVVKESHPEVCFSKLNGSTILSKKSEKEGARERIELLSNYLPELKLNKIESQAKKLKCNVDDIIDAICLAISANLISQGKYETIPNNPMKDEKGLIMQLVVPQKDI